MGEHLAEVNHHIRGLAAKLDPHDDAIWQFVCECGQESCIERIQLTLARYDELEGVGQAVFAPGHQPSRAA